MNRRQFLKNVSFTLASTTVLGTLSSCSSRKDRPNILWLTAEDMSPTLGCFGDAHHLFHYRRSYTVFNVIQIKTRSTIYISLGPHFSRIVDNSKRVGSTRFDLRLSSGTGFIFPHNDE